MAAVNIFKSQLIFLYQDVNKRALSGKFEAQRVFLSEYNPIYISYLYITGSDCTGVMAVSGSIGRAFLLH